MTDARRVRCGAAALCGVALLVLFQFFGNPVRGYINTSSLFYWWGYQWVNPASEGEHGWLILGLAAWLFWRNLQETDTSASSAGAVTPAAVAIIGGLAVHALGFAAQQTRICIVGFLLCLWGVLRLAGGRPWGRAALFPVAFLAFAIPLNLLDSVGFWLRMGVVNASALIARGAGIGVLQSGTLLLAPDGAYNYDVAAACSGLRSLTAMTALSLLAGYLNFHSWWRRALVLLLCFPLVYIGNVARIVAIIFAAQIGGPKWGDWAHEIMGYGIFVIVLGGVLLAIAVMRRVWPEPARPTCHLLDDKPVCHLMDDKRGWAVTVGVVVVVIGEIFFLRHLANLPPRGEAGVRLAADGRNPIELPAFIGTEWMGRRAEVSAVEREILPADTGYSRKNYIALHDPRQAVFLSIVLSGRDRSSIHRPELCLVGQGWTITQATLQRFSYPARPDATFPATLLRVQREVQTPRGKQIVPQLVAYWFVGGDEIIPTHWKRVVRDAWNRVTHARGDRWAYVLMQTDASDGEAAALARMQAVLEATLPAFQKPIVTPQ